MGSVHIKDEARVGSEAKYKLEPSVYLQKLYESGTPDLGWMNQMGEWGVRAKPGNLGLRLKDIEIGSYGIDPRARRRASLDGAARRGDFRGAALARLHDQRKGRVLGRQRERAVRRGGRAPVELGARYPVDRTQAAARRPRARDVPVVHVPHRGGVHRGRRADAMDGADESRLLRSENVPRHAGDGRGAPHGRVPQTRAGQRRRPRQGEPHQRAVVEANLRLPELLRRRPDACNCSARASC